jgi:hypothetical protein
MEIYRVEEDNLHLIEEKGLDEEMELEDRLIRAKRMKLGNVSMLPITRQGGFRDETNDRLDVLGVDPDGNLVIVELKKGKGRRKVLSQALDYTSRVSELDYDSINKRYSNNGSLRDIHADQFNLEDPLDPAEFNSEQRIILIGTEFDDRLIKMADYLGEFGIEVVLVEYTTYVADNDGTELLTTNAITRPREDEPESRDWLTAPKEWHIEEQTNSETSQLLENIISNFQEIESLGNVDWSQKNYVAFKDGNRRQVKFNTKKTQINMAILHQKEFDQVSTTSLASDIGIPTKQVSVNKQKGILQIKLKPENNPDLDELANLVSRLIT